MAILPLVPSRNARMHSREVSAWMQPSRCSACSSGSIEKETSTAVTSSTSTGTALGLLSAMRKFGAAEATSAKPAAVTMLAMAL
jgi:hypothetical protein